MSMRLACYLFLVLVLPASFLSAQTASGPTTQLTFTETSFDFGTVEEGFIVTHTFSFTNTGDEPLVIADAKGSCGCTVPQWPLEPIAPGESGEIKIQFNSKNKRGKRNQKVTLTANTIPAQTFLYLTGEVLGDEADAIEVLSFPTTSYEEPLAEPQPWEGPQATLAAYQHTVLDIAPGISYPYLITVHNTGTEILVIDKMESDCECLQVEAGKHKIAPGQSADFEIEYTAIEQYGWHTPIVSIFTNTTSTQGPLTFQLRANITPDLPPTSVHFEETSIDFGTVEEGELVRRVFTFTNTGDVPLLLHDARGSCGCTVPQWPSDPIQPGETASLTVEFNSKNKRGRRNQKITISANTDPAQTFLYLTGEVIDSDESITPPQFDFPEQPAAEKIDPNCFVLYPNPTAETLRLDLDPTKGDIADISIYAENGQLMAHRKVAVADGTAEFQVQHFPAGTYVAKVQIDEQAPSSRCFVVFD